MNGTNRVSRQSLSADESEESFVVLSSSMAPDSAEQNITNVDSSVLNSISSLSPVPQLNSEMTQAMSAMSVSAMSELSPDEIHGKLDSLLQENLQLKETLHQNNLAMKKQFNTLVAWQEDVMKVHQSHKEKFEETKKLIANLRAENAELKKAVQVSCSSPGPSSADDSEKASLKLKNSALEFQLEAMHQAYMRYQAEQSAKFADLQAQIEQTEKEKLEQSENLNRQINVLKDNVTSMKEKLLDHQKKMTEMALKIPSVASEKNIEELKKEVSELKAEIDYKNEVLKEKTDVLDKLAEENKKLQLENETIPILQTQVNVYQTDFNEERDARNKIAQEKEQITEDLRHLQRRNEHLLRELEEACNSNFVHVSTPAAGVVSSSGQASCRESPPLPIILCPLCSTSFQSMERLEEHVYHCIQ